jgi:hypothetical protein
MTPLLRQPFLHPSMRTNIRMRKEDAAPQATEPRLSIPLAIRDTAQVATPVNHDTVLSDATPITAVPTEEGTSSPPLQAAFPETITSLELPPDEAVPASIPTDTAASAPAAMPMTTGAERNGKAALPDLEVEGYEDGEDDLDEDKDEGEADPVFTPKDEEDFPRLESRVLTGTRDTFSALREIRSRKLWMLIRDDEGKRKYKNFDAYVQERWGHRRQWVTHGTNWLHIMEMAESLGIDPPILTVDAAQGLLPGRLEEAGGLLAVLQEAKEDSIPLTKDNLRDIVLRRANYSYCSKTDGAMKPAGATYTDYKRDCIVAKKLGKGTWGIVTDTQKLPGDFAENLIKLCTERNKLPVAEDLVTVVTGKALEDIVARLGTIAQTSAENEAKKNRLATLSKQIRAMRQPDGLKCLQEEKKALQEELEEKGIITSKNGRRKDELPPADGDADEAEEGEEEDDVGQVRSNLDQALQFLEDALDDPDWPQDADELRAILQSAQEVETKLAEITARAKELLADAPAEPEAIPSGVD